MTCPLLYARPSTSHQTLAERTPRLASSATLTRCEGSAGGKATQKNEGLDATFGRHQNVG